MPNPANRKLWSDRVRTYGTDPSNKTERAYKALVKAWFDEQKDPDGKKKKASPYGWAPDTGNAPEGARVWGGG